MKDHTYKGYTIERGEYVGTTDNNIDRWYITQDGQLRDKTGPGYATLREAKQAIDGGGDHE